MVQAALDTIREIYIQAGRSHGKILRIRNERRDSKDGSLRDAWYSWWNHRRHRTDYLQVICSKVALRTLCFLAIFFSFFLSLSFHLNFVPSPYIYSRLHKKIDLLWTWFRIQNVRVNYLIKFQRGKHHLRREVKLHQSQNRNGSYNGAFDGTSVVRWRDQSIFMVLLMVDRWISCVFRGSSYQWGELWYSYMGRKEICLPIYNFGIAWILSKKNRWQVIRLL